MVTAAMELQDTCSLEESPDKPRQCIKSRDITWLTRVCLVKAMVFPLVMYGCKIWTIKKAERRRRIDALELWCWRIFFRVPWIAGRSNQSILKEVNSEYSFEGLMLKLKLQYFGHLMRRAKSLEKSLMLGEIAGRKRRGKQRMRWLDGISDSMDMNMSKPQEIMKDRKGWHADVHRVAKSQTQLRDWTITQTIYWKDIVSSEKYVAANRELEPSGVDISSLHFPHLFSGLYMSVFSGASVPLFLLLSREWHWCTIADYACPTSHYTWPFILWCPLLIIFWICNLLKVAN